MALSRRALADGEDVVYQARPHWTALGWPLVAVVADAAGLVALAVALPGTPVIVAQALGVVGLVAMVWLAGRLARWAMSTLAVTTLRIVDRTGVLSRRGEEIRLDRVASLTYRQSLVGMVLGTGRLQVETGAGPAIVLAHVRRPARVQAVVAEQIDQGRRRDRVAVAGAVRRGSWPEPEPEPEPTGMGPWPSAPGAEPWHRAPDPGWWPAPTGASSWQDTPPAGQPATAGGSSVADRLALLQDLYRRGLVSEPEYAAKRAELLAQI